MNVRQILDKKGRDIFTVDENSMVYDAIYTMSNKNIGALVVTCGGKLCGMISERDYRDKVILKGKASKETRVKEIMTRNVFCVTEDYGLQDCMSIMSEKKIRHIPVIDQETSLKGIISIGDIVKAVIDEQKLEIQDLRNYITSSYPG